MTWIGGRSPLLLVRLAIASLSCLLLAFASPALADTTATPDNTFTTNGHVFAVARSGNTLYIGGEFTQVGPPTGPLGSIGGSSGAADPSFPKVTGGNATIYTIVSDGAGGEYIGGNFLHVGGLPRSNIAHVLASGAVDPAWNPNVSGEVRSIVVVGATVYFGGIFTDVNGSTARSNAAAVSATTGVATAWNPDISNLVCALAYSSGVIYLDGFFAGANSVNANSTGVTRNYAAAVDATTGVATTWNPNLGFEATAIAISASTVYLGGVFTTIGGTTRNHAGAVATGATATLLPWNPNLNGQVNALAVSGGSVYIGGGFQGTNSVNANTTRNYAAAVDPTNGTVTAWNPNFNSDVNAFAFAGNTVYVAGGFSGPDAVNGGATRNYLAAVDATTATATAWSPNASADAEALLVNGANVIAGGAFSSLGALARQNAAAIDLTTGQATPWNPNVNNFVEAIAVSGTTVYLGGNFTSVNGSTARNYAAAFDAATGAVNDWNPAPNNEVTALAVGSGPVYLGGYFTQVNGGTARNYLASVDPSTGVAVTGWNPGTNGAVSALALSANTLYLGGVFHGANAVGSATRSYAAAVDATSGAVSGWDPHANSNVNALAVAGATVYLGGGFTTLGTVPLTRNYAGAVDATSGAPGAWNPNLDATVFAVAVGAGSVYIGGAFTSVNGGTARKYLAAVDPTSGLAISWDPHAEAEVRALATSSDGSVYVGTDGAPPYDLAANVGIAAFNVPPTNTALPSMTGAPAPGQTLTCGSGAWSGSFPQTYTTLWLRDGTAIAGATGSTYLVALGDLGHTVSCAVTASNLNAITATATTPSVLVGYALTQIEVPTVNSLTGAISFTELVNASGTLSWVLSFPNGKYGVYDTKRHHRSACSHGKRKLRGRCRPTNVVYSRGSKTVSGPGDVGFTAKPTASGLAALRRAGHKGLEVTATLTFTPSAGGSPVVVHETVAVKLRKRHKK